MIRNLEALLAQGQDGAHLRFALANQYLQESDLDKALEHAQVAVKLDADYSAAWRLLGQILVARGAFREAMSTYERGIAVAEQRGDKQVAREMRVFLKRLQEKQ